MPMASSSSARSREIAALATPYFRGGIGGGGFRSAAIGGLRGGRLAEAGSVPEESSAPASAGQFAWPASVVVALVGAGVAGVCPSQVSVWAWATTATHPIIRIPASFGTATPGSTPATEMACYELRLDRTRRFTPGGFCIRTFEREAPTLVPVTISKTGRLPLSDQPLKNPAAYAPSAPPPSSMAPRNRASSNGVITTKAIGCRMLSALMRAILMLAIWHLPLIVASG